MKNMCSNSISYVSTIFTGLKHLFTDIKIRVSMQHYVKILQLTYCDILWIQQFQYGKNKSITA